MILISQLGAGTLEITVSGVLVRMLMVPLGLICGMGLAAGVVSLISSLGIIQRMVGKSATADHILVYENALMSGAILGNTISVFPWLLVPAGALAGIPFGICAGVFVGCLASALAEVVKVWPILFRRTNTKSGLGIGMVCFALGKLAGSLYFFLCIKDLAQ